MNDDIDLFGAATPFDTIRHQTPEGREFWSARELMPHLDYDQWRNFSDAIGRAHVSGTNAGHDMTQHIAGANKMVEIGSGANRTVEDHHLSRLACYLIAMNGDPRKQAVADAQTYFAIKTREAETVQARELTDDELIHRALTVSARRVEALTARVAELEPSAAAWTELADAAGDYSVADAAKVLSRDPNISTGERRLFGSMQHFGWIYREGGRWRAYQRRIEDGRLVEKVGKPYIRHGEMCVGDPTVRVTPKGLATLQKLLGGGSGQLALAVAE